MPLLHKRGGVALAKMMRLILCSLEPSLKHVGKMKINGKKRQNGHADISRETEKEASH